MPQKRPGRIAAGKRLTEFNRKARQQAQQKDMKGVDAREAQSPSAVTQFSLKQVLSAVSIVVSLVGLYYKRKEIMATATTLVASSSKPKQQHGQQHDSGVSKEGMVDGMTAAPQQCQVKVQRNNIKPMD